MTKVVSIINLKGGVAKTTTTVQLAECLASEFSQRVLVIDLDPQTNATVALIGEDKWEELDDQNQTIFQLFNDKLEQKCLFDIRKALQRNASNLRLNNLTLLPSSMKLIEIQDHIYDIGRKCNNKIAPMEVLKTTINNYMDKYDYILIDCPPNLGYITKNGIEISDYFFIPTIPDTLSTYGIPQIIKNIHELANDRCLKISCLGLVITKYSSTSSAHRRGMKTLPARFANIFQELQLPPSVVFNTVMPQANTTAEAMEFDSVPSTFREKYGRSKSGNYYLYEYVIALTKEFMQYVGN